MTRRLKFILTALLALAPAAGLANQCAIPASSGIATGLSGIVNTYFPGGASVAAGATTITLGAGRGAGQAIAAGDLLLVIQMQDALFAANNNDAYGDGVGGGFGSGYSNIQQTGRYEYVRAGNAVPATGGTLTLTGATGAGLVYGYRNAAASSAGAKASFQVVRVPQYRDATITGTLTASSWNGSTGGIVAIDVAGRLSFSGGRVDVSGLGFRGGGGRALAGGNGANTDYRTLASVNTNGAKGEGVAGTPRFVNDNGILQDIGVEGYNLGSNGRGAPGNAGGGGTDGNPAANDQNTGGGGGGNGGVGGRGGHAWCPGAPTGCPQAGGHPGSAVAELGVARATMGGGGGAGATNNATGTPAAGFASSGAAGGGVIMVRAGEIAGSAAFYANGASANGTVVNDGSGGGGAGGSVLVSSLRTAAGSALSVFANGGNGGSNTGGGAAHGPGGGGGGGFVATSIAAATSVFGGAAGTTQNGGTFGAVYGATGGNGGNGISVTGASIPGLSSGAECTPTVQKSFATPTIVAGGASRLNITVTNNNPTLALTALAFTDTYPSGLLNTATPLPGKSCTNAATMTAVANGGSFAVSGGSINAAGSCTFSVNTTASAPGDRINTLGAGAVTGAYGTTSVATLAPASAVLRVEPPLAVTKSSQTFSDPVNGATNPKAIPGGLVTYTIAVSNPGTLPVDNNSILVVDATPANLQLSVGDMGGGAGPVVFQNGTPSSALTYSFGGLASTTDDVEFSNDGGATWTYTPTANASGVDPRITHMRIRPKGSMAAGSTFSLLFRYLIS